MNKNTTILLAEDEENDIFLLQRAVRKMNISVDIQVARDGEEVIQYLSGREAYANRERYPLPELILLDIKMPRKTGFDVLEWLKQESTLTHIPVVMLTSSTVKSDMDRAHNLGAIAYLVKPIEFGALQELLTNKDRFLALHRP